MIAFLASFLTVVCVCGGLMMWAWWLQAGLIAGVVAGLIASSVPSAAIVAGLGAGVGLALGPVKATFFVPKPAERVEFTLVAILVAFVVGAGIAYLVRRVPAAARVITWLAIAVVVANLWATTLVINRQPTFNPMTQTLVPSLNEQLQGNIPPGYEDSDHVLYLHVYESVRAGQPYYQSFRKYFIQWSGGRTPNTVLNIRVPIVTYLWAALPGPLWIVILFLALASLAVFSIPWLISGWVKLPLAIPAAAAGCTYFLYFTRQLLVLTTELWAVIPAMLALAALAASLRSRHWRALTILAVHLAVLALVTRETLGFVPVAGLLSAVAVRGEQRRFRIVSWLVGLAAAAALLGAHYWVARSVVDSASKYQGFAHGGFPKVLEALTFGTDHFLLGGWLALTLAVLGLLGAALMPDLRLRIFALTATVAPLVSFLFVSNAALDTRTGTTFNYWGVAVVPLIYMCIPFVFGLLPGAATSGSASAGPPRKA